MPVDGGSGGGTGRAGGRGGKKPPPIVVHNPATGTTTTVTPVSGSSSGSGAAAGARGGGVAGGAAAGKAGSASGSSSSSSSSSSSASSSTNAYLAAQNKARKAAQERYLTDAANLQGQIRALRHAIGPKGEFKDALKRRLKNIDLLTGEQLEMLDDVAAERAGSLDKDMEGNRTAAADQSTANDSNRARERTSALAEIAAQGAGESDGLRSQLMSLRSWDANQGEVNRAFHDSQRSIQAARLDLQADTATAKANAVSEANADREQLWNEFYAQNAESLTQLGNTLGQQAEYYGLAIEQGAKLGSGKGGKGGRGRTSSGDANRHGQWVGAGANVDESWNDVGVVRDPNGLGPFDGPGGPRRTEMPQGGLGSGKGGGKGKNLGVVSDEDKGGKGRKDRKGGRRQQRNLQEQAAAQSDAAFMQAANWMGRAWKNPGLGDAAEFTPDLPADEMLASSAFANARTTIAQKRPEGATLRKW